MTADTTQILEATIVQADGHHAIVSVTPLGGGNPVPMRVAAQGTWPVGAAVHVKAKTRTTTILEDIGGPDFFGPLTPAPPTVADVLTVVDRIALAAAPAVAPPVQVSFPIQTGPLPAGLIYTAWPADYAMPQDLAEYGDRLVRISERQGKYVRGLITGPTGAGKSTFVQALAAKYGRPYCRVSMPAFESPAEVFGQRTIEHNGHGSVTGYDQTPLIAAVQQAGCILQIDEINRVHASVANGLLDLLDDLRCAYIPGLNSTIRIADGVIVLGTMNQGVAYSGTFQLDAAMRSRLSYPVELDYLDAKTEIGVLVKKCGIAQDTAEALIEFAADVRQRANPDEANPLDSGISTRQLIAAGDMIGAGGATPAEAVRRTILPLYSTEGGKESQRQIVEALLQGKFAA